MLELRVSGDSHPKTFTLVTDDSEGELHRLQEILVDEMEADPDDPIRKWLDGHTAEQFAQGVEIPQDQVGEFEEIIEGDWWDEAEKIAREREAAMREVEDALTED